MWKYHKTGDMKVRTPLLVLATAFFWLGAVQLRSQSMIDKTKEEVSTLLLENHKEFRRDRSVVNQRFNYLKYVNGLRTRTWIFYFTDEDLCRSSKLVCDYDEYDEVLEELNSAYDKLEASEWYYLLGRDTIQVRLERLEWYFTVREARKK